MNEPTAAQSRPSMLSESSRSQEARGASPTLLIVKRELGHYLRSKSGYVIAASHLLLVGLLFNVMALGDTPRYSHDVLADTVYYLSGMTMFAANFFAMRLFAEERQTGTLVLLRTAPITEGQLVWAKFLSALVFLSLLILTTVYMPALVFLNGSVSFGHIAAGYLGLFLLGAAVTAIGTFGSALANSQIVAIVVSGLITLVLIMMWVLGRFVDGALGDLVSSFAIHDKHFRPFMEGTIRMSSVLFYVSVTGFFLMLARYALESRRWRS